MLKFLHEMIFANGQNHLKAIEKSEVTSSIQNYIPLCNFWHMLHQGVGGGVLKLSAGCPTIYDSGLP